MIKILPAKILAGNFFIVILWYTYLNLYLLIFVAGKRACYFFKT